MKVKVLKVIKTTYLKNRNLKYILEIKVNRNNKKISCFSSTRIHKGDTVEITKDASFLEKYELADVGYVTNTTTTETSEEEKLNQMTEAQEDTHLWFSILSGLNLTTSDILDMEKVMNLTKLQNEKVIVDGKLAFSPFAYLIFGIKLDEIKNILKIDKVAFDCIRNEIDRELNTNGLIYYFLQQRYKNHGDLCFPKSSIYEMVDEINTYFSEFNYEITEDDVKKVFKNNIMDLFSESEHCYYLNGNYVVQEEVINALKELNVSAESSIKVPEIEELTDEQNRAIKNAVENKLSLINGGPGVGKSFTVKYLAEYLENNNKSVCIASLTARVAQKMQDSIKYDNVKCSTIHKMLNLNEFKKFNMLNDIECDYLILEEASMININLFKYILTHLSSSTHLILVGDYNQLPPVGAGQVFKDLCKSKNIKKTTLTKIFRQATENSIVSNSYAILKGQKFSELKQDKNFYAIDTKDTSLKDAGIAIVEQFLKQRKLKVEDVTILASTKNLANAINFKIQEKYNINKPTEGCIFKVGDKVMQNINNREKQIWNGNTGTIDEILEDAKGNKNVIVNYGNKRIVYNKAAQKQLNLAYCYTIHKAQGMENNNVIILVDENEKLLNRNLVYTAVTRAKETCVLVGKKENIDNAIKNNLCRNAYSEIEL